MAYTSNYSFGVNGTGRQGVLSFGAKPKLSDVFGGLNPFYLGQSFTIEEVVTIYSSIDDYSLLRSEDRWFEPKQYIGTWQRLNDTAIPQANNNDYGLIRNTIHQMSHCRQFTISADPSNLIQLGDGGRVRQCNLFLEPSTYLIGGTTIPVTGFAPVPTESLLIYENFTQAAQLIDKEYDLWYAGFGLFFYPGMSGISVEIKVGVIDVVYNGAAKWSAPVCGLNKPTCDEEFQAYILTINQGHPIDTVYPGSDQYGHYSNQTNCNNDLGAPCQVSLYTCSDGGTRQFWYRASN